MADHPLRGFKNVNIVSTKGSMPSNPTGQLGHPKSSKIVANDQVAFTAKKGSDGFSAKSPKASVKVT